MDTKNKYILQDWHPEDIQFWNKTGSKVAKRNLWISIPCLLLSFCVWMLFSTISISLNKVGFHFSTNQLFLLTALPSISGAILRVPYSFIIPILGGRKWTAISTIFLIIPCIWLGFAIQDTNTSFEIFVIISLLCGFAGANFASSMANISLFYPKNLQGGALGLNGGLGNLGVSVMQLVAPLIMGVGVFAFIGGSGQELSNGSTLWLENIPWIWVPLLVIFTVLAWIGMNDIASSKMSLRQQLHILKYGHLWVLSLLYFATFGSFIGFSAGFAMLSKTQFPDIIIIKFAFFGPLLGALARPLGGMLSDRFGGTRVTTVNFIIMAICSSLVFLTLPNNGQGGSFIAFYCIFMLLFLTAGLGSGSTFQMIAIIFRKLSTDKATSKGASIEEAEKTAIIDTSAALGFISAIGAFGGFFIPKSFGTSLTLTGSAVDAMILFSSLYIICIFITWFVYRRIHK